MQKLAGFYKIYPNTITVDVTNCNSVEESTEKVYNLICKEGIKIMEYVNNKLEEFKNI